MCCDTEVRPLPVKHHTTNQRRFNVGPASQTLAQRQTNIGATSGTAGIYARMEKVGGRRLGGGGSAGGVWYSLLIPSALAHTVDTADGCGVLTGVWAHTCSPRLSTSSHRAE